MTKYYEETIDRPKKPMDIKINWKADEIEKGNSISSIIK
jgi:hypothetical protein